MQFKDIIGHQGFIKQWIGAVERGRTPHAQMLIGGKGAGQLPLALAMAQYLSCPNKANGDSCGTCWSCRQFQKLQHPDLHLVFPILALKSKHIEYCKDVMPQFIQEVNTNPYLTLQEWVSSMGENKVASIYAREGDEIIKMVNVRPFMKGYKIILIWHPEAMQMECANKVLKVIEEPPKDTLFILVTEDVNQVLGTIVSRSQLLYLPPIEQEALISEASQRYPLTTQQLLPLAKKAHGSWSEMQKQIEHYDHYKHHDTLFFAMMRAGYAMNLSQIRAWVEEFSTFSRPEQSEFLQAAQALLREGFISRSGLTEINYMNSAEATFMGGAASGNGNKSGFSAFVKESNIEALLTEFALAEAQILQNVNSRIVMTDVLLRLYKLLRQ